MEEPESIRYSGDGVYANPMSVSFEVDEPMTLSVSCVTTDGVVDFRTGSGYTENM